MLLSIDALLVTVPCFKETIVGAVLPHVHKPITEIRATHVRAEPDRRRHAHPHPRHALDDMRRTLQTLASTEVSTEILMQTANAAAPSTQLGETRSLPYAFIKSLSRVSAHPLLRTHTSAHATYTSSTEPNCATFDESQEFAQRAIHTGGSPPTRRIESLPSRCAIPSAPYYAPRARPRWNSTRRTLNYYFRPIWSCSGQCTPSSGKP